MIKPFAFECPQYIHFGPGERNRLGTIAAAFGKKIFFITGRRWFEQSGWKQVFSKILDGCTVCFRKCESGEPTVESISRVTEQAREFDPDLIIGCGGGSVIDTAKAVSGLVRESDGIGDYCEGIGKGKKLDKSGVPWIAIPTTAGTGAEATKNAVVISKTHRAKKSFRSPFLLASTIIVDPELTAGLDPYITGISGLDALVQLIESFVSKKATPMPRALVKHAFPVMLDALFNLGKDIKDMRARTGAAYGALISGIALANSGLGAVHGFASGIGGLFDIPHGLLCAEFLVPVLKMNADAIREDMRVLCGGARENSNDDPVEMLIEKTIMLLDLFNIPKDLGRYGIDKSLITSIAEKSEGSSMSGNPKTLSLREKEEIILSVV
ncbi:MAG: iron-containing alcohol dehydrogenase [Spirochaetales bacterium]|nr:iron-containing alcohol dehydrogenase [Spirochaetales bacterium]